MGNQRIFVSCENDQIQSDLIKTWCCKMTKIFEFQSTKSKFELPSQSGTAESCTQSSSLLGLALILCSSVVRIRAAQIKGQNCPTQYYINCSSDFNAEGLLPTKLAESTRYVLICQLISFDICWCIGRYLLVFASLVGWTLTSLGQLGLNKSVYCCRREKMFAEKRRNTS